MPGAAIYSGVKAGLDQATRVLAAELGPQGVRANVVAPGLTETEMAAPVTGDDDTRGAMVAQTPLGRLGQPEDIAKVAVFLASDDAAWVTGQVVQASGGLLL
jgi:3-oxoacyl-[acyl-carrier protein] reductase